MTTVVIDAGAWVPELTFGARLALVRHKMGWNVKEAAAACGLPAQSWRGWEMAGHLPRRYVEIAKTISTQTGVDYHWLVFGPDGGDGGALPTGRYASQAQPEPFYQHERPIATVGDARRPVTRTRPRAMHRSRGASRPAGRALAKVA